MIKQIRLFGFGLSPYKKPVIFKEFHLRIALLFGFCSTLIFAAHAARASIMCKVWTETSPQDYSTVIYETAAPPAGLDEAVNLLVSADKKTIKRIPKREMDMRVGASDFKDFDGGTIISFQQAYADSFSVQMLAIEPNLTYPEFPMSLAVGGVTGNRGVGLLISTRKLYAQCAE